MDPCPANPPAWVRDAVFYQVFPDRFARSKRAPQVANLEPWGDPPTACGFKGGDLFGLAERLPDLADLGVTALYLNPIFQSTANHRYHTHDYLRVDPLLGGDRAFSELLEAARRLSLRVILDGVFNHASRGFYAFNHVLENGPRSPYVDWFRIRGFPLDAYGGRRQPNYEAWWNLAALPKLNTDNDQVREFLFGVAEHWLRCGADGWRLDVPLEIRTPGFWQEFRLRVKAVAPDAYLVAEIWEDADRWLDGTTFDAALNYPLYRACLGFFGGAALDLSFRPGGFGLRPFSGDEFADRIDALLGPVSRETALAQLNLLGSHDTPRFLTLVGGDRARLRLAALFQMTFAGAPCIYYGDEIGLEGGADPDCRRAYPVERGALDLDLREWYRRLIGLRRSHAALRRGDYVRLVTGPQLLVFARRLDSETLVVLLNAGPTALRVDIPVAGLFAAGALADVLTGERVAVRDGILCLELPALSGAVVAPAA